MSFEKGGRGFTFKRVNLFEFLANMNLWQEPFGVLAATNGHGFMYS